MSSIIVSMAWLENTDYWGDNLSAFFLSFVFFSNLLISTGKNSFLTPSVNWCFVLLTDFTWIVLIFKAFTRGDAGADTLAANSFSLVDFFSEIDRFLNLAESFLLKSKLYLLSELNSMIACLRSSTTFFKLWRYYL